MARKSKIEAKLQVKMMYIAIYVKLIVMSNQSIVQSATDALKILIIIAYG